MTDTRKCRNCAAEVPGNAPFGHCPGCLLDLGFGPLPDEDPLAPAGSELDRTFGDYELLEQIGQGGMGIVFKARHRRLNRLVAIKMIRAGELATPRAVQRFQIEAEAAARLDHPRIVAIFEVGRQQEQNYLCMRLIEGRSLEARLADGSFGFGRGPWPTDRGIHREAQSRIVSFMASIARSVHYAHQRGVLHRDLKPGNILLDAEDQPHLTDFGLAKLLELDGGMTRSADVMGTPAYMAPEQAAGRDLSIAADVYSLGVIFYELLTGRTPFRANTPVEMLRLVTEQEPPAVRGLNPGVDRDLETICLHCLEKEPARRYPSADALAGDLERWLRGEPIEARPLGRPERLRRWVRRNRVVSAAIAMLLVALAGSLWLLRKVSEERDAKQHIVRILIKSISQGVERFAVSTPPSLLLTAEELVAFTGASPQGAPSQLRLRLGVFVAKNPLETVVNYARFLPHLEEQMSGKLGRRVRVDLKIYRDVAAARAELRAGHVDIVRMDGVADESARGGSGSLVLLRESTPGFPTLFITRPDTGITNLAGLRGRRLGLWARDSVFSVFARARLAEAGLCESNLHCVYLLETPDFAHRNASFYFTEAPESDHDRTGVIVPALTNRQFDAVVCPDWQLRVLREGHDWTRLDAFPTARPTWLARQDLEPEKAAAFQRGMMELPSDTLGLLSSLSQLEGAGVVAADVGYRESLRRILLSNDRFARCTEAEAPETSTAPAAPVLR